MIRRILSTMLFSGIIALSSMTMHVNLTHAAPGNASVKKCKAGFEYSTVFQRCIRDHGGDNR